MFYSIKNTRVKGNSAECKNESKWFSSAQFQITLHDLGNMRQEMNFALILLNGNWFFSELTRGIHEAFTYKEIWSSSVGTKKVNIKEYQVK